MHATLVVDVGDVDAAGIAAPAVEHRRQPLVMLRQVSRRPQQQIGAVRVVVARDELVV